jgi:hypothetical protein
MITRRGGTAMSFWPRLLRCNRRKRKGERLRPRNVYIA